jgi:hypothetical protein
MVDLVVAVAGGSSDTAVVGAAVSVGAEGLRVGLA